MACGSYTLTSAPILLQRGGNVQRRSVSDIVRVRLEGSAECRHPHAGQVAPGELPDEVHGAGPAALVDRVNLTQERHRLPHAELLGSVGEGTDVLGQAAAAETRARLKEPATDAGVVGQCARRACGRPHRSVSQTSAIALMKEILVARKEFAATLTSSAVVRSVTTTGVPRDHRQRRRPAGALLPRSDETPNTSRSGLSVSSTA